MTKKTKVSILVVLTIIATFVLVRQAIGFHSEIKKINFPNRENRFTGNMDTYRWVSVKKLSQRIKMSEQDIFKNLEIVPQKGDENMPITELGKKYNKKPEEMKSNLERIIGNQKM